MLSGGIRSPPASGKEADGAAFPLVLLFMERSAPARLSPCEGADGVGGNRGDVGGVRLPQKKPFHHLAP